MTASLYDIMMQDRLTARKKRELLKANLLTVLVADADKTAKDDGNREPTDADVIVSIRKLLKGVTQNLTIIPDDDGMLQEKAILEFYLPPQMSDVRMIEICEEQQFMNIGSAMSFFKMNHVGEYDNNLLSKVVKEHLTKQK